MPECPNLVGFDLVLAGCAVNIVQHTSVATEVEITAPSVKIGTHKSLVTLDVKEPLFIHEAIEVAAGLLHAAETAKQWKDENG